MTGLRLAMVAACAAVTIAGCGSSDSSDDAGDVDFPSVELVAADSTSIDTADWQGQPLVVNFWYSTCPPCAKELADFAEVHEERGDDVRFIGVNPLDDVETMTEFAGERGVEYELYRDDAAELQVELGVTSFPTTVFIDADGRVVDRTATLDADGLRSEIDDLLAGQPGDDGDNDGADTPTADQADGDGGELTTWNGIRRDPPPAMSDEVLPSVTDGVDTVSFRPDPGRLQVVYFGFTSCPDVCPTTMSDLSVALRQLGGGAEQVDVVMISVDPDRDRDTLATYVDAFVPGAVGALTDDQELLEEIAAPFGATWEVRELDDGTIEVDHTAFLYAVDDTGHLALTWPFGISPDLLADDMTRLLDPTPDTETPDIET